MIDCSYYEQSRFAPPRNLREARGDNIFCKRVPHLVHPAGIYIQQPASERPVRMGTMKNKFILSLAATAALLVCTSLTHAAELDRSDRNFLEKAAKASQNEVTISQEALPHLTSPSAREFAQMMVTDHTQANAELSTLAASKGVTLPMPSEKVAKKWAKNDKDVDDEYLAKMVDEHKDAVDLFEKGAKSKDADIAAFAQKMLPTLRSHLAMAKADKKIN